jgi:molecular chaperone GrpE (heat shock protein)
MNSNPFPKLAKAPFLVGDALLLGAALWLATRSGPFHWWMGALMVAAVAAGAWLAVAPFVIQFRADVKAAETAELANATAQLGDLGSLAQQIGTASAEWQQIHNSTSQTVAFADQIAEKIIAESRTVGEALGRLQDAEKNHLKLELEKLKRSEGDWLQVLVRLFDHIYALQQAAARSGQRNVSDQLTRFQAVCRDVARRVGFISIIPQTGVPFDSKEHHLLDGEATADGATVAAVVAPGYSFQGQLLRLPGVSIRQPLAVDGSKETEPEPEPQLPLGETPGSGA